MIIKIKNLYIVFIYLIYTIIYIYIYKSDELTKISLLLYIIIYYQLVKRWLS